MSTLTAPTRPAPPCAGRDTTQRDAPPLRLPRHLLAHLAQPITSVEDVDRLMVQIRIAEYRGLL